MILMYNSVLLMCICTEFNVRDVRPVEVGRTSDILKALSYTLNSKERVLRTMMLMQVTVNLRKKKWLEKFQPL